MEQKAIAQNEKRKCLLCEQSCQPVHESFPVLNLKIISTYMVARTLIIPQFIINTIFFVYKLQVFRFRNFLYWLVTFNVGSEPNLSIL